MLSTKSSSVTFFIFKGEHEFHGFNECFPILLIAVKKHEYHPDGLCARFASD